MSKSAAAFWFPLFACVVAGLISIGSIYNRPVTGFIVGFILGVIVGAITVIVADDFDNLPYRDLDRLNSFYQALYYVSSIWINMIVAALTALGCLGVAIAAIAAIVGIIWLFIFLIGKGY